MSNFSLSSLGDFSNSHWKLCLLKHNTLDGIDSWINRRVCKCVVTTADGGNIVEIEDITNLGSLQVEWKNHLVTNSHEEWVAVNSDDGVKITFELERCEILCDL